MVSIRARRASLSPRGPRMAWPATASGWSACSSTKARGEGAVNARRSSSTVISKPCGANSSASAVHSCHGNGGGPVGAPTAFLIASPATVTASWMAPAGIHALRTIRPADAVTRAISAAAARASEAKITPNVDSTTSASPSPTGSAAASPSTKVASRPRAAALTRATSSSRGAGSTPITLAPRSAASSAALPVPQPTSTTRSPTADAARSTTTRAAGSSRAAVSS